MTTIRAVLLRGPILLGAVLVIGIELGLALTHQTPGLNLWADRVNGLTSASIIVGVVAAGAAALEANRWDHAQRDRARTSARPWVLVRLQHVTAVLLPLLAGYWLAVAAVSVEAAATGAYGAPPPLWLASLGGGVLLAGMVGYVLGAILPFRWYVGPLVGLAFYTAYVVLIISKAPYGVISLFPASTNYYSVFTETLPQTLLGQTAFFLTACVTLTLLLGLRRVRTAALWTGLSVAVVVSMAAAGTVLTTNGQVTTGHNPRDFACSGTDPVLCLNAGYAPASKALHKRFHRLNTVAAGTALAATRLEQNVEGVGDQPSGRSRSVYLEQWSGPNDLDFSVFRYVRKYGGLQRCDGPDGAEVHAAVDSWLSDYYESSAGASETPLSRRLAKLDTSRGATWFRSHYGAYASCTLTPDDVP
jgi:hypothetical protein